MLRPLIVLRKNIFLFLIILILGILLGKGIILTQNIYDKYKLNQGTYEILIKEEVIEFLNKDYTQKEKRFYCLDGDVNEFSKEIYIESVQFIGTEEEINNFNEDADICKKTLGVIHTHSKTLGIFPICKFSGTDKYKFGAISQKNNHVLGGLVCSKNRFSFYLSNSEKEPERYRENNNIGYSLFK